MLKIQKDKKEKKNKKKIVNKLNFKKIIYTTPYPGNLLINQFFCL